ncbi:Bromodomain-containing protein 9, partial [Ophiophagus hannah]
MKKEEEKVEEEKEGRRRRGRGKRERKKEERKRKRKKDHHFKLSIFRKNMELAGEATKRFSHEMDLWFINMKLRG